MNKYIIWISSAIIIPIMMAQPIFFFLAAGIGIFYIILCKPDYFSSPAKESPAKKNTKDPSHNTIYDKDIITYEDMIESELERSGLKPGFEKCQEWQEKSKILRDQVEKARYKEEQILNSTEQN